MTRDKRQDDLAAAAEENNFNGTLVAATGFGKSRVGLLTITRFNRLHPMGRTLVIVPTIDLQIQWLGLLSRHPLQNKVDVMVINTAYKKDDLNYDFYILDEAHRYGAPEFGKIFHIIDNYPTLMLTATIERSDGMDKMLLAKAPIIGTVPIDECLVNGWVSPYTIYNIPVMFTPDERQSYDSIDSNFKKFASLVGGLDEAMRLLKIGTPEQKRLATMFMRYMRLRKTACQTTENKLPTVMDCLQKFKGRRAVVFSEDISFADELYHSIPENSVLLHSKLKAADRRTAKTTFETDKTKTALITVRAANEGIDVPDLSLAVIAAGNSQKRDMIQRIGRILRNIPGKHAIIINLYVAGTQSEIWLRSALRDFDLKDVHWVKSLNDIPYD